jgi:tRNA (mo5U34)-methyltransferase
MPGHVLHALHALWQEPGRGDEYVGTLVNAWLARGGRARGICAGETYVDVGTMHGWREAVALLGEKPAEAPVLVPFRALQQTALTQAAALRADQPLRANGAD